MSEQGARRIDIISDTHGRLSPELMDAIAGAGLIIHAGDITSEEDWEELKRVAPIRAVLGNNDYYYDYGPEVGRVNRFDAEGLSFAVAHYREDLPVGSVDVAVCGHTHRPKITNVGSHLVINPGSPTYPRSSRGATMARLFVQDGVVLSAEIVEL